MRRERRGLFYLTATAGREQLRSALKFVHRAERQPHCYHHIEMRPEALGRVLGIGLRVAGRVAGQRISAAAQPAPSTSGPSPQSPAANTTIAQRTGKAGGGLARGVGGFLKPFRRVGGILWLEVTGVFFFLPVLVFTPTLWRTRFSFAHGPDHRTFIASAIVVVIFFYLGVSSFWRARRK
jgi:hypothetical protein